MYYYTMYYVLYNLSTTNTIKESLEPPLGWPGLHQPPGQAGGPPAEGAGAPGRQRARGVARTAEVHEAAGLDTLHHEPGQERLG